MKIMLRQLSIALLSCLSVAAAGIYFRTFALQDYGVRENMTRSLAGQMVYRAMADQLKRQLDQQFPQMGTDDKWKLANQQAEIIASTDKENYDKAIESAVQNVRHTLLPASLGRHYLLEADPYHFFYLAEQIEKNGRLSSRIEKGKYYHPLMRAPAGYWPPLILHPYLGVYACRLMRLFKPGLPMMEALCYFPLGMCLWVAVSFFILTGALKLEPFGAWMGGFALMLSPIFIQRSAFGWFDTDPYNYLFPFSILTVFFLGLPSERRAFYGGFGAGFLTGLYALFWIGWPFMLILLPSSVAAAAILMKIFRPLEAGEFWKPSGIFLASFLFFVLVFACLFLTPDGFLESVKSGWVILRKFALSDFEVWPNIFLTVGEAQSISLKKLIFLTGNYVTAAVALAGLAAGGILAWKGPNPRAFFHWLFLAVFSLPLLVMSLKTERFSVLFVIPLSIFVAWGMQALYQGCLFLIQRWGLRIRPALAKGGTCFMLAAAFLGMPVLQGYAIAPRIQPIMNDVWYQALKEVEARTPSDAIVNSWWPPGYFITAIAHRRVSLDGGTQHLPEAYWMAKALAAEEEGQAAGLLRMLNTSGHQAFEYLESLGFGIPDATDLILRITALSRKEAKAGLPQAIDDAAKEKLLDFTHGKGPMPPTYVLVYDDLIVQNLAMTVVARWDMRKAFALKQEREALGWKKFFIRHDTNRYLQDMLAITEGFLKYTPESGLEKRKGDILFFQNGLMVNLAETDAYVLLPDKKVQGRPISLFYLEEGQLMEKRFQGGQIDASALLFLDEEGNHKAVMADPRLIRSVLFRLYYLKAQGLKFFKPFASQRNKAGTVVAVYELDRSVFSRETGKAGLQPAGEL